MEKVEYETKEFTMRVAQECKKLNSNGRIFITVGEKRNIRRSISNDYIDITVLSVQEKRFMENMLGTRVQKDVQPKSQETPRRVGKMIKDLNGQGISTRDAIRTVKPQKNKTKRNLKNRVKKLVKKVYKMIPKTKEEIKKFIKKNGIKVGVGITVLALMGTIASTTLKERAESIQRYNSEYTSVEQVEEEMRKIIESEIINALEDSNIITKDEPVDIDIYEERGYRGMSDAYEVSIKGNNFDHTLYARTFFEGKNVPQSLDNMIVDYFKVQRMNDSNMTDSQKYKAIKLLDKVKTTAAKRYYKFKETLNSKMFNGTKEYNMRDGWEIGD